jgi:hypothetical protein
MSDGTDECDDGSDLDSGLLEPQTVPTTDVSLTFSTGLQPTGTTTRGLRVGYDSAGGGGVRTS